MHALAQLNSLPSLNSVIDSEPITVTPDTQLSDAITLMCQNQPQATYVLVVENSYVLGWLTEQDLVRLLYLGVDCKKTIISEVMVTSLAMLTCKESNTIYSMLLMLHHYQLPLLPVLNEEGKLFGCITLSGICKTILTETVTKNRYEQTEERWKLIESAVVNTHDAIVITQAGVVDELLESQTERKQIEEELAQTQIALKEANEQLEIRVAERTKALREMNRQLVHEIADRQLAEEQLRQSQEMLQLIMDNIPQSIFWKDTSSVYLGCNRNFAKIAGFNSPEDIVGKTDYDLVSIEQAEFYHEFEALVMEADKPQHNVIVPHLRKDGKQIWLETNKVPLHDAEGNVVGVLGSFEDITERKRGEESLRLRDRAIAASSNGIVICDATMPDWPIIYVNPAFERITGYSSAEVLGKNCRFLQNTDTNQPELETLRTALTEAKNCTVILRNYRKDGALFWNELSISPVYDTNGKTYYIGIQTDITERKQSEVALLVSQERLQYLHSSIPGVIYTCKPFGDYGITFVSDNVVAMTGYEVEEFLQDSGFWQSHIHPEDLSLMICELSKLYEQGQNNQEYRFLHKDGTYRWVYDQAKLVRDDDGNPLEIVGYWVEITHRKQLEEDLTCALEKEKELNELKSRFIAMTSHEFRTPLSTILSSSELLEHYRHKWKEEKQIIHLRRIQNAVKHLTGMLNDVLVIGKVEAGRLDFRPAALDLVEYCRNLVEEIQLNVHNQHLSAQPEVSIAFYSEYQFMPGLMDEKLLGHILSNLLSNAIKYSPTGSTVEFTLTSGQEQAVFEIQDQGIGIPEEDIPRLFESFYRATNVGNIPGTGLGLAIVKNCVDIHNGEITVISEVGVGTKFKVILPLGNG